MTQEEQQTQPQGETDVDARHTRRRVLQAAGSVGVLAFSASGLLTLTRATAKDDDDDDDDDDDNSGSGSGSGGDDHSGHGGGNDNDDDDDNGDDRGDDDVPAVTGEIPAGSIQVTIDDDDADGFSPGELTVDLGALVTFVNLDKNPHTATGSGFDTGVMEPGQTATVTLNEPGRFAYACLIHPIMTGSIAVRDANGDVPAASSQSDQSAAPADAATVQIVNFAFEPPVLSIAAGTTVVWSNDDAAPHTVTATDGAFDSGIFDPGAAFSFAFAAPGTYAYRCDLHPAMEGTIEVSGDAVATGAATAEATPSELVGTTDVSASETIVGTWDVVLTPTPDAGLSPLQATMRFADDGTVSVEIDQSAEESGLGLAIGPARGTWLADEAGGLRTAVVALLLDAQDQFAGSLALWETIAFDGEDRYDGTVHFLATDLDGAQIAAGEGTSEGTRASDDATPIPAATPEPAGTALAAEPVTVTITNFLFEPVTVEIPVGGTISWINRDAAPHTATALEGAFDTGRLNQGQERSHTFETAGTFDYQCLFHPTMTGTIVVA